MKSKILFILPVLMTLGACSSQPEPNLELFSPDAFAFNIGDYWEVNATIYAKGFAQAEREENYIYRLSYSVDVITSESDTIISIFDDWIEEESPEEYLDTQLEAQIEIDSSFMPGKYRLIFNVKDELYDQSSSIAIDFNLTK